MGNVPYYEDLSWKRHQPLRYRTGAEIADSIVIASDSITADSAGHKIVAAGEFLCEISSGTDAGKWGPYSKTASDGREAVAAGAVAICVEGHDVALGDESAAGYIAFCAFDMSQLTMNGYSLHSTSLTTLKTAFPNCEFLD